MTRRAPVEPPRWTNEQLEADRRRATQDFRRERMEEPLEIYLRAFDERQAAFEDLLETTVDLTELGDHAIAILTDARFLEALRYLAAPPISLDDLKTLADATSLAPARLRADTELAQRLVETVMLGVDQRRFPWLSEGREPSDAERASAILASAALMASQRTATTRRSEGKTAQERQVEEALIRHGLTRAATRNVATLDDAPNRGEFCRESMVGSRKADIVVRLWDRRVMPIECKVSNSATNSIKRLNNDAAVKARIWRAEFGERQVVPSAVLSGVYKLKNLEDAQTGGLTLFWAHDLARLLDFIDQTR